MKEIEEEIKHLSQLKRDYREMFNELLNNTSDDTQTHHVSLYDGSPLTIKRDDIVGMTKEMEQLDKWLDPKELNRVVISVMGFGGLGKTTLVRKVYDRAKGLKSFDSCAWIEVSHNYDISATLRQLIQDLNDDQSKFPTELDTMHCDKLNDVLRGVLSRKRYLIVLDNVWDTRVFIELFDSLTDDIKGSRIIITTRNNNVASLAQEMYRMKLSPLDDDDAFELFVEGLSRTATRNAPLISRNSLGRL